VVALVGVLAKVPGQVTFARMNPQAVGLAKGREGWFTLAAVPAKMRVRVDVLMERRIGGVCGQEVVNKTFHKR